MKRSAAVLVLATMSMLSACGGGGGGSLSPVPLPTPTPTPSPAPSPVPAPAPAPTPAFRAFAGALPAMPVARVVDASPIDKLLPGGLAAGSDGRIYALGLTPVPGVVTIAQPLASNGGTYSECFNTLISDGAGAFYASGNCAHGVYRLSANGTLSVLAGGLTAGRVDGKGTAAQFNGPNGIAVDGQGNLFVTDAGNSVVRKIAPDGTVSTLAGGQQFRDLAAIVTAPDGGVDVVSGHAVQHIGVDGKVSLVAGQVDQAGFADGRGATVRFANPRGIVRDRAGNLFVADHDNRVIRKIALDGSVSVAAGKAGVAGAEDGSSHARLLGPTKLSAAADDSILFFDADNNTIRKLSANGEVSTLGGTFARRDVGAGWEDGPVADARFDSPGGIAVDAVGNVLVADAGNQRVRKIGVDQQVGTLFVTNGGADVALGVQGRIYTLARQDYGYLSNVATKPAPLQWISGTSSESVAFPLPANLSALDQVTSTAVATDASGAAYVMLILRPFNSCPFAHSQAESCETVRSTLVYKVEHGGGVSLIANVKRNYPGGVSAAQFPWVKAGGLAVSAQGEVVYSDPVEGKLYRLKGDADPVVVAEQLEAPTFMAVDATGTIYVAEAGANRVRRIPVTGPSTVLAGTKGFDDLAYGVPGHVRKISGLALDGKGHLLATVPHGLIQIDLP